MPIMRICVAICTLFVLTTPLSKLRSAEKEPRPGSFDGRVGELKKELLKTGGGSDKTEAAIQRGLKWIVSVQNRDGSWSLNNPVYKSRASENQTAATALALLPLLGQGYTHKGKNPYSMNILNGLRYLVSKQSKRDGSFSGGSYANAMATIAICEAYGLSQDARIRVSAQLAVNYLVRAQHQMGGWRYAPQQSGDLSVTTWVVVALKTAESAGLAVPKTTFKRAVHFVNTVWNQKSGGYGYVNPAIPREAMTACGLLCRQYLQNWGPTNANMIKGLDGYLMKNMAPKQKNNCYYYYYATQVMHHVGGKRWKQWNEEMTETLLETQNMDKDDRNFGSWPSRRDRFGRKGGRLMVTSFNLLTLEAYYRHVPFFRDS